MTTTTKPDISQESGIDQLKRHIVPRNSEGVWEDKALCGYLWDRIHPMRGEMCRECVRIYQRIRPGWPLPSL